MKNHELANSYWKDNKERWQYAMDHYDGSYAVRESDGGRMSDYLFQKYQRENNKAFEERQKVTDPVLHFGTIVDSINGVLSSKQDDTIREWGDFGDVEQPGSIADQLWYNADGDGTNWEPFFKKVGIKLTILHEVWGYVKGVTDDAEPCIKLIDPRNVINFWPMTGELQQVLICEKQDIRTNMTGSGDNADLYTLFTTDGWEQYTYDDEGVKVQLDSGQYAYYSSQKQEDNKRILPIFRTKIPMPRHVGWLLAKKENHIFNQKSVRDFAIRNMSFSILKVSVTSETEYTSVLQALEKGANVIPEYAGGGQHGFISPDSGYLAEAQRILERDVEDFYINGFKKYGETARQVTATQVKLESQSGIESFLNLLVNSLDEFENAAFWRLEQVNFPNQPSRWGKATVKRSTDFQPEEMPNISELARTAVDLDRARAASTQTIVQMLHPTWDEQEVNEEVARINTQSGAMPVAPELIE